MKLNLLQIANEVADKYIELDLSVGKVKLYLVPNPLIWSWTLDRPRPKQPMVEMKITGGKKQKRLTKEGDPEHDEWKAELEQYERDLSALQNAVRYVEGFRDLEYPDISQPPPSAIGRYNNGDWPDEEMLRKKIWIDCTLLAKTADLTKYQEAVMLLNDFETASPDSVDEIKKNSESI